MNIAALVIVLITGQEIILGGYVTAAECVSAIKEMPIPFINDSMVDSVNCITIEISYDIFNASFGQNI